MDIMDTARLNIKRHREIKGLRQQDMADKLSMSLRSYQSLESGETKLDIERLERIAEVLETNMEELLRQDGYYIHQEVKEGGNGSGFGLSFRNENTYNYGVEKEIVDKLLEAKDGEMNVLKDENKMLKEEVKYLQEKVDQLMGMVGKKDA
ncbi:helix-turn-helix domain-containing protein [Anaerophaga thermohalophila]|jgi:transcriptional regulator with XRE-family HTH domain|uniref:helix-turn-helix domain-containing protein n=1 Tax=Anaerophaga thermohalophila TaxID=177400 RepID=UPI0002FA8FD9|nr:helix-turn-helix transcriptional regulator [Anaerophaga thermohalophila]